MYIKPHNKITAMWHYTHITFFTKCTRVWQNNYIILIIKLVFIIKC